MPEKEQRHGQFRRHVGLSPPPVLHHLSRRRSSIAALTGLLAVVATACGGAATPSPTHHASAGPSTPSPSAKPTPAPPPPLAAPVIIQVENLNAARPQSGLSQADIVYEYDTEGGISRFSAVYFNTPAPPVQVGPVRSARLVTVKLVQVYDATLLYSGASVFVSDTLANTHVRQYDETTSGALFRINSRVSPHNLYTDGSHLAAFQQKIGPHNVGYQLWGRTPPTSLPPGGTVVPKFEVPVSQSENPAFTYDPATGGYLRVESDTGIMTDANTGAAWEPKTIVILPVSVTIGPEVEDVSGTHGLDFALVANGPGQLAVGGQLYPINFTQSGYGPPQLTLANGSPAPVAPGQVLIELVGLGKTVTPG